jgi:hypothetical protein
MSIATPALKLIAKAAVTPVAPVPNVAVPETLVKLAEGVKGVSNTVLEPPDWRRFTDIVDMFAVDPPTIDTQNDSVHACPADADAATLSKA